MKAIRIHDYGDANALIYEDAPIPEPPPDGVLIKVHAAGVNPVDWKIRKGLMRAMRPLQFPAIMGSDIAGTVALAGPLETDHLHPLWIKPFCPRTETASQENAGSADTFPQTADWTMAAGST